MPVPISPAPESDENYPNSGYKSQNMSSNSSAISRANDRRGVRYPYGGCDRAVDAEHVATIAGSSGGNAVIVPHSDATGANNATAGEQMSAPFLIDILTIGASARSRRLRVSAVMTSFPTCNGTIRAARRRTSAPIAEARAGARARPLCLCRRVGNATTPHHTAHRAEADQHAHPGGSFGHGTGWLERRAEK
jgi:hypothetical protein